jgi:signal peptidase I
VSKIGSSKARKKKADTGAAGWFRELLVMGAAVVLILTFVAQAFDIPSSSMLPGLLVGDRIVALKFSYGYSRYSIFFSPKLWSGRIPERPAERGDVVVFRLPSDPKVDYIKRVIGLPGDRVQMKGGRLFINGQIVERRALGNVVVDDMGAPRPYRMFEEKLPNGKTYNIYHAAEGEPPGNNTPEYVVPPGHYFMMGDNRDNSCDSRFNDQFNPAGFCAARVGYVPFENFVGRASFLLFSTDGSAEFWELWKWPFAVRYSRFLMGVR